MFKYLLANLLAPLLRPIFNAVLILMVAAFVITVPARLWVLYVDPRPSDHLIVVLNVGTLVFLLGVIIAWRVHLHRRRVIRRRYWAR